MDEKAFKRKHRQWRWAGKPKNYKDADLPKMIKDRVTKNAKKAAVGAGVGLATYGAYKMHKRRQAAKKAKNESLDDDMLGAVIALAEEHYDVVVDEDVLIDHLLDAAYEYEDEELLETLFSLVEEEEKEDISGDALKRTAIKSAASYAGATVGEQAAEAAWKKLTKKKTRKAMARGLGKAAPYAAGAAIAVGAAELASRALKRRRDAKAAAAKGKKGTK